jgi:hypothetical protein
MLIRSSPSGYTAETYTSTYRHRMLHVNLARHSSEAGGDFGIETRQSNDRLRFVDHARVLFWYEFSQNIFGISRPRRPISVVSEVGNQVYQCVEGWDTSHRHQKR